MQGDLEGPLSSVSAPLLLRFKSVANPLLAMGLMGGVTRELHGNCCVFAHFHILIYGERRHYYIKFITMYGDFFVILHSKIGDVRQPWG